MRIIYLILFFFFYCITAVGNNKTWGNKPDEIKKSNKNIKIKRRTMVAIIDTGIDLKNSDIKNALWSNPGETGLDNNGKDKSSNQIDDDNNGFVDDVHGWNFVNDSTSLQDNHGHGTHIAGIIHNIAPDAQLVILKFFDPKSKPQENLQNTIKAIKYANQIEADIINYSGGGLIKSIEEEKAVQESFNKNILFVAAAGNESSNTDIKKFYPASYNYSNILSVAAANSEGKIISSSNFGSNSVTISAPGEKILSYLPENKLGFMTGTSQATAFVSGTAALFLQTQSVRITPQQVINHLTKTALKDEQLAGKTISQSHINGFRAIRMKDQNTTAEGTIISDDLIQSSSNASFNFED